MSIKALFETELENDESETMEDLFSEAIANVEDAMRRVDKMQ